MRKPSSSRLDRLREDKNIFWRRETRQLIRRMRVSSVACSCFVDNNEGSSVVVVVIISSSSSNGAEGVIIITLWWWKNGGNPFGRHKFYRLKPFGRHKFYRLSILSTKAIWSTQILSTRYFIDYIIVSSFSRHRIFWQNCIPEKN